MSRYADSSLMSGLSSRLRMPRRRRVHRRTGHGILSDLIGSVGLGRRRRVYHRRRRVGGTEGIGRRRRHGRGFLDVLKTIAGFALPAIAGPLLGKAGSMVANKLLGGRRRRIVHHRRRRGGALPLSTIRALLHPHMGSRRVHHRVHHRRGAGILL